jgi:hypothetical protein
MLAGTSLAATINVPGDYTTIQAAVDAASNGDVILVAPGTYTGTGGEVVNTDGKAITIKASGTPEETIINGGGAGARRVITCSSDEGADTIIEGFTITGGAANHGGGIYCYYGSPTITDCTISGNTASIGGGIYCWSNSSPTLTGTVVCGNEPDQISGTWTDNGGNSIGECCPDIDGDGVVGVDEVLAVIAAWDTDDGDTDVNYDGIVDVEDLLIVISTWGPCE